MRTATRTAAGAVDKNSDWFSWENQHGSIAVADLDGDGHLELLVLTVDNPAQKNRGLFGLC
jgi:hypothetical protein